MYVTHYSTYKTITQLMKECELTYIVHRALLNEGAIWIGILAFRQYHEVYIKYKGYNEVQPSYKILIIQNHHSTHERV